RFCFDGEADADRVRFLLDAAPDNYDAWWMLADVRDRRAASVLLDALGQDLGDSRRIVVRALGLSASDEAIPALLECAVDDDYRVRAAAITAIARIGGPRAADALAELIARRVDVVAAASGLAWLGDAQSLDVLTQHVHDAHRGFGGTYWNPVAMLARLGDR